MGRFIVLEVPAICNRCKKLIRAGRLALWMAGTFRCYTCARKGRGEATECPEERQMLAELLDERDAR
jgi:hypothetical protein